MIRETASERRKNKYCEKIEKSAHKIGGRRQLADSTNFNHAYPTHIAA
jgi:hypothetical protein